MRITIATFNAAAMLFAISSSLPQPARQGEKSELDHGDTTHSRRLISRGSKERRDQQVFCSGKTMYDDNLSSDIANATAQADGWCSDGPPVSQKTLYIVNNIQLFICNNGAIGCTDKGQVPGYIAQVQAQCGANKGGWFSYDSREPWSFGLDPAGTGECGQ